MSSPETELQSQSQASASTAAPSSTTSSAGSASAVKGLLRGHDYATQVQMLAPDGAKGGPDVHAAAAQGVSGGGGALPYASQIQRSFGGYDISNVQAHTDAAAANASASMGANAYATGNHVVLGNGGKDLHTVAHEAAHVVQQRAGVQLSGGVGKAGDAYEQHADKVADAVVAGKSAEPILAEMAGGGGGGVQQKAVQREETPAAMGRAGGMTSVGNPEPTAHGSQRAIQKRVHANGVQRSVVQMDEIPSAAGTSSQARPPAIADTSARSPVPDAGGAERSTSTRSTHEWRAALLSARNNLVQACWSAKEEYYRRARAGLEQFERTMTFAAHQSVGTLLVSGIFNEVRGALPQPLNAIVTGVTIVADALGQSSDSAGRVALATWIEQKSNRLERLREEQFDPTAWPEIGPINAHIEALVELATPEAEQTRQRWELAMLNASFPVTMDSQRFEFELYDQWCYNEGAYFMVSTYQTDRHYPGQQEVGTTDQAHPAFNGRQVSAHNVPTQILDRLARLGIDPQRALNLPTEVREHHSVGGRGPQQWRSGDVRRRNPYEGERRDNWTGPERFRQ